MSDLNIEEKKKELKSLIKQKFAKPLNSLKSFEELAEMTKLSSQTLRRFFGKIDLKNKTSTSTLSLLCKFVGFQDWQNFEEQFRSKIEIHNSDKILIENMSIFFKNGEKYNSDYFQKTSTVDTLNDYSKTIYASKENTEYFYKLYKTNNWATDYLLAYIPNYNFYGLDWFRKILTDKAKRTKISHVKLSQTNFLCFGAFLSKNSSTLDFNLIEKYYDKYRLDFNYMPYHEMRYCTIQILKAKSKNENFEKIIYDYLKDLEAQSFSAINQQELIIFFCNTLFWLQEYKIAYRLLKDLNFGFKKSNLLNLNSNSIHYLGMNMAFVKITFSLIYIANKNFDIEDFKIINEDFNDSANLLYQDYIQILFLTKSILFTNGLEHKKEFYKDLKLYVEKTNYSKIYDILEDLDCQYLYYST